MWVLLAGFIVIVAVIAAKNRHPISFDKEVTVMTELLNQWAPIVSPLAVKEGIDPNFVMKWIEVESGGNPCAVGSLRAFGPDGNPREMGIAQFYNPDDLTYLRIDGGQLRAYCVPGTQSQSRALTANEMLFQVNATVALVKRCMAGARRDLASVGVQWSEHDFYCLTKLQHGLPGISHRGIPAVAAKLGRPPAGWNEFKANLQLVKLDSGTEAYRAEFPGILLNAEKTASVISTEYGPQA